MTEGRARAHVQRNALDDIRLEQMFLRDPNGVPLEINFRT